ncbi:CotS family spore coat protein [Clostridium sp. LBM24168]
MAEKYTDKKFLTEYDLCIELFKSFDLKVYDVVPVRNVYMISTDKGEKILKKIEYTQEELSFIYDVLNYIRAKFNRVVNFVKNKQGDIYTIWNGDMYCIMDVVDGIECNFNNPIDLTIVSKSLGELHRASEGFKTNLRSKYNIGKTIDTFKRRIEEMEFFKNIVNIHEKKNAFDEIFIKDADYYIDEIKKSINMLEDAGYYKLCSEDDKIVVCHNDLAYHNVLIKGGEAYFIDFDYALIDIKVHDLCNFINKVIKNFAFDINKAKLIIKNYCKTNSLSSREIKVLDAMLNFPYDFYTISRDYYARRKEWDESVFLERIRKKASYKEDRKEFLENFQKEISSIE